jgi:hypothetical protein
MPAEIERPCDLALFFLLKTQVSRRIAKALAVVWMLCCAGAEGEANLYLQ